MSSDRPPLTLDELAAELRRVAANCTMAGALEMSTRLYDAAELVDDAASISRESTWPR